MRWLITLALCVGCGSEWLPAGGMLQSARNNSLAATQQYQSQQLKLTGTVISSGKKKVEHDVVARTDGRWIEARGADADAEHPFVEIRDPEHPSTDFVTCYLEPNDVTPQVEKGGTAHVDGFFVEFVMSGGHVEAVLNRCSVQPVVK